MFKYEGAKNNSYIAKVATISHEDIKELLLCRKKNLWTRSCWIFSVTPLILTKINLSYFLLEKMLILILFIIFGIRLQYYNLFHPEDLQVLNFLSLVLDQLIVDVMQLFYCFALHFLFQWIAIFPILKF